MVDFVLQPSAALAGHGLQTTDLVLRPVDGLAWAAITVRAELHDALAGRLAEKFGFAVPSRPAAVFAGAATLLWSGPGRFSLVQDGDADLAGLSDLVGEAGDVTDLTGSQVTIEVAGAGARRLLAKLVAIDLDPAAFRTGSAAATIYGHIGVALWQVADLPTYRITCARSFAESLWHGLERAAAGLSVARPAG